VILWVLLPSCNWLGGGSPPAEERSIAQAAQADTAAPLPVPVQSCTLPAGCPPDGLDAARCTTDPAPFVPTLVENEVVAISVDPLAIPGLGLAAGDWWTAWNDGVSCTRTVAWFTVDAEVAP
jgi:hypothetical protein